MIERWTRSYGTLGRLNGEQLQAALDRFGLGTLHRAWPLTDGAFGKNVALDTSSGAWVLRGDPWPPESDDQFRRERFFALLIDRECDVPAPVPYFLESEAGIFPWPYAVMKRFDGGIDLRGPTVDWTRVAAALGRGLADLHRITWSHPGEWDPTVDAVVECAGSHADFLRRRIEPLVGAALDAGVLGDNDHSLVLWAVEAACDDIETAGAETTLIHHDFKPANVCIVERDRSEIQLAGVFDLNEGYAGDPLEDLPRGLETLISVGGLAAGAAYLSSYQQASGRHLRRRRLCSYLLLDLLLVWEFGNRPDRGWFEGAASFESWAQPVVTGTGRILDRIELGPLGRSDAPAPITWDDVGA